MIKGLGALGVAGVSSLIIAGLLRNHSSDFLTKNSDVCRSQIFKYVTGVEESKYTKLKFYEKDDGFYYIKNKEGREFQCGKISMRSLGYFKKNMPLSCPHRRGKFNIIYLKGGNNAPLRRFADIAALQANLVNRDAVFQLASRFNALENFCVHKNNFYSDLKPKWLTTKPPLSSKLFSENASGVQGEEGALSAASGGIFRMYGDESINLLFFIDPSKRLFAPYCPVVPGKDAIDQNKLLFQAGWDENLLICFHEGIEVVTGCEIYKGGERSRHYSEIAIPGQIIHQIPVSAFNFKWDLLAYAESLRITIGERDSTGMNDFFSKNGEGFETYLGDAAGIAKSLLNATYLGTLLASVAHEKRKIFLTMVGGGVFFNRKKWISEAINNCRSLIKDSGLKVYLVVWDNSDLDSWFGECKELQALLKNLNGQILYLDGENFKLLNSDLIEQHTTKDLSLANNLYNQFLSDKD